MTLQMSSTHLSYQLMNFYKGSFLRSKLVKSRNISTNRLCFQLFIDYSSDVGLNCLLLLFDKSEIPRNCLIREKKSILLIDFASE